MTVTCKSFYLSKVYVHNLFTFDNTGLFGYKITKFHKVTCNFG